ncbi:amino acid transport system permease protein [Lachnospiraceae bacterium KM106-2]|nr:amino acid transport system permease protein [Lachnospiraceae bacterium KM106-2]
MLESITENITQSFITDGRYRYLTQGLLVTIEITFLAVIIGMVLGFLIALIRSTYDLTGKRKILNFICKVYLTIVRGTPVIVQLLLMYFVILDPFGVDKIPAAVITFGCNSAAYVAEIVRSGIMSVDGGQTEAGRSIGFSYSQTMIYIVLPQAFKNVLPALLNEWISLLKETSVSGYIAIADLTKGGDVIRSITFRPFFPLVAVALVYLGIVMLMSALEAKVERRLRRSER